MHSRQRLRGNARLKVGNENGLAAGSAALKSRQCKLDKANASRGVKGSAAERRREGKREGDSNT